MSRAAVALVLVAALVLPACGSSDSPAEQASDTTSPGAAGTSPTSGNTSSSRPAPLPGTIEIVDFTFSPREVVVARGETITWRNEDPYAHWVVSTTPDVLDSGELSQAQTYSKTFSQAGTYDYYCNIHNYMKASVTVQ